MTDQARYALDPDDLYAEATRLLMAGWDYAEVAETLGVPVAQVRVLWSRFYTEQIR